MIGIVLVTHSQLGYSLIETAEFILGSKTESVTSVSINIKENVDELRDKISKAIKQVDKKTGILILTDMFGGTPSNLSYSFLEDGRVEVISGVNLPVLIRAVGLQNEEDLSQVAKNLVASGKRSISLASGILKGSN
ncbi:MAG: PTS fructose transporter subunit IIA [Proteobacteria bacterium]|nr:PTS fructose transporter subunit IIA [Pseudomonadota bacterium]